jgi:ribosomal protein S18 acetylase RimI-like enzyme
VTAAVPDGEPLRPHGIDHILGGIASSPEARPELREPLLDLWVSVTNAGGSVGFAAPADRDAIGATLDRELADVTSGRDDLLVLSEHDTVIGMVFLRGRGNPLFDHWRTVMRLMVHPGHQRRGHAASLLREAEGIARSRGCDHLQLTVRGGEGLEAFYERQGYREVGRHPGAVRMPDGTDRDEVMFVRSLPPR